MTEWKKPWNIRLSLGPGRCQQRFGQLSPYICRSASCPQGHRKPFRPWRGWKEMGLLHTVCPMVSSCASCHCCLAQVSSFGRRKFEFAPDIHKPPKEWRAGRWWQRFLCWDGEENLATTQRRKVRSANRLTLERHILRGRLLGSKYNIFWVQTWGQRKEVGWSLVRSFRLRRLWRRRGMLQLVMPCLWVVHLSCEHCEHCPRWYRQRCWASSMMVYVPWKFYCRNRSLIHYVQHFGRKLTNNTTFIGFIL